MADAPLLPAPAQPETSPSGAPIYRHTEQEPAPFELASGNLSTIEAVTAHIERHLGPVSGTLHEIVSDKVHLDVHIVAPSAEFPFYTLVTSGMSDRPMLTPDGASLAEAPPYAELCILLPPDWPLPGPGDGRSTAELFADENVYWPIRWLKTLARLPHEYHTWLGFGHTVPNGEDAEPLAGNTELGCLLLLTAISLPEEFQTLRLDPTKTVQFYTLFPLYREEMELKMNRGVDALLDGFIEQGVSDVVDLARPNVGLQ